MCHTSVLWYGTRPKRETQTPNSTNDSCPRSAIRHDIPHQQLCTSTIASLILQPPPPFPRCLLRFALIANNFRRRIDKEHKISRKITHLCTMSPQLIDDGLAVLDHVAARVTATALTGLGCGAAFATHKGFPIAKTSLSASLSCALVSTACFSMERLAFGIITHVTPLAEMITEEDKAGSSSIKLATHSTVIYSSHALGGVLGGAISGFLFQGNPFSGAFLLTPLMLCAGKMELSLADYKAERLRHLMKDDDDDDE